MLLNKKNNGQSKKHLKIEGRNVKDLNFPLRKRKTKVNGIWSFTK